MNKRVSIIIPAYNIEDYIGKCLDSVLAQDMDMNLIEIIVVDDGSSDDTWEVLNSFKNEGRLEIDLMLL